MKQQIVFIDGINFSRSIIGNETNTTYRNGSTVKERIEDGSITKEYYDVEENVKVVYKKTGDMYIITYQKDDESHFMTPQEFIEFENQFSFKHLHVWK